MMGSAACLMLAAGGFASEPQPASVGIGKGPKQAAKKAFISDGEVMLKVSFKMMADGLEGSGNIAVQAGSQGNYVSGGETPFEADGGKGVEYKKARLIVNCVPVVYPSNRNMVRAECQFEISGPLKPAASSSARPLTTFQIQTAFAAEKGRPILLVDEPTRRIEVKIEDLAP